MGKYRPRDHSEHTQQVDVDVDADCDYGEIQVCSGNGAASAWIRVI